MAGFLTFLAGPIGRWLIIALLVTSVVVGGYYKIKGIGWDEREEIALQEEKKRQEEQGKADARYAARLKSYIAALDIQIAALNDKIRKLEFKNRELVAQLQRRVPEYVTPASDKRIADCGGIPLGFVLHYDAGVRGETAGPLPPAPEGGVVDRDSGVALSRIADTIAYNHGQFHRCITALKGWEEWYPAVKATYEKHLTQENAK